MNSRRAVICEELETRALLSNSPTVTADLAAVRSARKTLAADRAELAATLKADAAAVPAAVANISTSVHEKEKALETRVADDLNQIGLNEYQGPAAIAADAKAVRKFTARLEVDQLHGNTPAAATDAASLASAQQQLAAEQASVPATLAADKAALAALKASQGSQVRAARIAAVDAVQAAKLKLTTDHQQGTASLNNDDLQLAAAVAKLRSDS